VVLFEKLGENEVLFSKIISIFVNYCVKIKRQSMENKDDITKNISRVFKNKSKLRTIVATKPKSKPLAPVSDINEFLRENFVSLKDNGHEFWISKYLVTQGQYESIMGNNPSYFKGEKLPVESVSWYDAAEFCNRLSAEFKKEQRYIETGETLKEDTTKKGFRLPTKDEWIYAAKHCRTDGTETTEFAGTNDKKELKNYAWYYENSGDKELDDKEWDNQLLSKNNSKTHEVGTTKKAKELNIHDMSGNVWEWCEDWYDSSGSDRVLRGGSWVADARGCHVLNRSISYVPTYRSDDMGFRLVLPL
jgi:formylglycine-generating enzyme required for sulfatase activity